MKNRNLALTALGVLILVWTVVGFWLGPAAIEQAYRGESLPFLNDLLGGRDVHPVERYLDAWRSLFLRASAGLAAVGAVVWTLVRFSDLRKRAISGLVAGGPELTSTAVLSLAVQAGLVGGLAEAVYQLIRQIATQRPAGRFYSELFWMAPLSAAVVTLALGVLMVALAKLGGVRWHIGKAATVFAFLIAYAVLQSEGVPLHSLAVAALSLGLATVAGRYAAAHAEGFRRSVRIGQPIALIGVVAMVVFAWFGRPVMAEQRAMRGRPAAESGLPNILVIILDTVRAQNLSLYGYERPTTPEMERWARGGVMFEEAIATEPWTLPTHASVFTGRYNFEMGTSFFRPLDETFPTLAEILVAHGYQAGGFTANTAYTTDQSGLERGFDRWEDWVIGVPLMFESSWVSRSALRYFTSATGRPRKIAEVVTDQFLAWEPEEGRPFFAFLNLFDAHSAYYSPPEFERWGPLPTEGWHIFKAAWRSDPTKSWTVEDTRLWVNQYDNAIGYLDHHLGLLRDSLEARGVLDNTIVVITADHGESWGENGQLEHAQSLYSQTLHVPLVISYPRAVPTDVRVAPTVSLVDVPSTILDLAGLPSDAVGGRSLSALWSGDDPPVAPSPALSELAFDATDARDWTPVWRGDMKSLVSDHYHFILNGDDVVELYDLESDPLGEHDLASDPAMAPTLAEFRARIDSIVGTR